MYQLIDPHPLLKPFIECYWVARSADGFVLRETIYVDGKADVMFNFGSAYERTPLRDGGNIAALVRSNVDGQRKFPLAILQQGSIDLVGVRFQPGGLAAFLPLALIELSNHTLDIGAIFGAAGVMLEQQLYDCAGNAIAQAELLNTFFLRLLNTPDRLMLTRRLASMIDAADADIAVWRMSRQSGYSIRQLDRLFNQYLGFSPKFYARIVRFQRALDLLMKSTKERTFAEIAYVCGCYDQAHLNKEFNALAGSSPQQVRLYLLERTAAAPPPTLVQFLQA